MAATPEFYRQVTDALDNPESLTVLVVTGASREEVSAVLDIDLEKRVPDAWVDDIDTTAWALLELSGGLLALELTGYGDPTGVQLRKLSESGRAVAVVRNNIQGNLRFGCARDGQLVFDDNAFIYLKDLGVVPAELRPLVDLVWDDLKGEPPGDENGPSPLDVAFAMAETITHLEVTAEQVRMLQQAEFFEAPVPLFAAAAGDSLSGIDTGGLETFYPGSPPAFLDTYPALLDRIAALPAERQRLIAHWAAVAAVAEAGLTEEPAVREMVGRLEGSGPPPSSPALDELRAQIRKRSRELEREENMSEIEGGVELAFTYQRYWAVTALRQTVHPDPRSAAVMTVAYLLGAVANTRPERVFTMVEDETGRWMDHGANPAADRVDSVARITEELAQSDPAGWPRLTASLPQPLSPEERTTALARDNARLLAGEFSTYQFDDEYDDDEQ